MNSNLFLSIRVILMSMRIPFLVLTPVCVFLGISVSVDDPARIDWFLLGLVMIGALAAHISVNTLNEYLDFKSGLDLQTKSTAFSGGGGALPRHPEMAKVVLTTAIISIVLLLMIGLWLIYQMGATIMVFGFAGLLIIITYTQWINKHPILCLLAPGAGFGLFMVIGTHYIFAGEFTVPSVLVALVPFFLVNNLLLLNQYPDIQADANVGRKHFPITYGIRKSNYIYGLFVLMSSAAIIVSITFMYIPAVSWLSLLPMPLALYVLHGANRYKADIGAHPRYLGANVGLVILTPLLLGLSILAGD